MWRQVFRELRALTNDKTIKVNPLQLNDLYEHLWNLGQLLTTERCFELLNDDFRPWPKHPSDAGGDNFYAIHDRNKVSHHTLTLTLTLTLPLTLTRTQNLTLPRTQLHHVGRRLGSASRLSNAGRHCRVPTYCTRGLQAFWGRNSGVVN